MFSFKSLLRFWDKFFFEEKPVYGLAIFRITWLGMLLTYFLMDLSNIDDFYGPHALLSLSTVNSQFNYVHLNIFHFFKSSYEVTYGLAVIYGVALFFSFVGFFSRISMATALVLMVSFHQRNIWLLSSSEVVMRLVMIWLVLSPCGNALSVDSLLGRKFAYFKLPKMAPVWTLRMIQIQLSVIYVMTAWQKMKGEDWFDGHALYYATRLESMTNFKVPFLLDNLFVMQLLTWGTLILEIALGTLIWFKEFRLPVLITGFIFHLGIEYMMSIPFFELNMMALLLNFFTPEEHKMFVLKVKESMVKALEETNLTEKSKLKVSAVLRGNHD